MVTKPVKIVLIGVTKPVKIVLIGVTKPIKIVLIEELVSALLFFVKTNDEMDLCNEGYLNYLGASQGRTPKTDYGSINTNIWNILCLRTVLILKIWRS